MGLRWHPVLLANTSSTKPGLVPPHPPESGDRLRFSFLLFSFPFLWVFPMPTSFLSLSHRASKFSSLYPSVFPLSVSPLPSLGSSLPLLSLPLPSSIGPPQLGHHAEAHLLDPWLFLSLFSPCSEVQG